MRIKKAAIYLRVSTVAQDFAAQETELRRYAEQRGWQVTIYADKVSGVQHSRPALDQMWRHCRARKVDIVLVWSLDRFARSLKQLIAGLEEFRELGIDFVSLKQEGMDTTTSSGRLLFHIVASVAEFERDLLRQRVASGLAEAKRKGTRLGRPPIKKLSPEEITAIRIGREQGKTLRELATTVGASLWAVHQAVHSKRS